MKKADRIASFVEGLGTDPGLALHPCYQGFLTCFNRQEYYEAHDVLEHLWLRQRDENWLFFKGLIQLAGAFVHLKKQHLRPDHPKDGRRLGPASRLFRLAQKNLEPYRPEHLRLDVSELCRLCDRRATEIVQSGFARNPWRPDAAPVLEFKS